MTESRPFPFPTEARSERVGDGAARSACLRCGLVRQVDGEALCGICRIETSEKRWVSIQ